MFLEPNYGEQIAEVIKQNPNAGIITCLTNRIGSTCQLLKLDNNLNNDSDILTHKQISSYLKNTYANSTIKVAAPLSFFVTIVSKKVWKQVGGYDEKFDMLHFDWDFSYKVQNAGYDLLLMQGMYVFHYYRLHSHIKEISHLV
jgi:GT2 family glycosyltransferase